MGEQLGELDWGNPGAVGVGWREEGNLSILSPKTLSEAASALSKAHIPCPGLWRAGSTDLISLLSSLVSPPATGSSPPGPTWVPAHLLPPVTHTGPPYYPYPPSYLSSQASPPELAVPPFCLHPFLTWDQGAAQDLAQAE